MTVQAVPAISAPGVSQLIDWPGWAWPGWIALGALGTVLALFVLGTQSFLLWRQLQTESIARRQEIQLRSDEFEREHTPILSLEGQPRVGESTVVFVAGTTLHAEGQGFAQNVGLNLQVPSGTRFDTLTTIVLPLVRPPSETQVNFQIAKDRLPPFPALVRVDVFFTNIFNQTIRFTQSGRPTDHGLNFTDAPHFQRPWVRPALASAIDHPRNEGKGSNREISV